MRANPITLEPSAFAHSSCMSDIVALQTNDESKRVYRWGKGLTNDGHENQKIQGRKLSTCQPQFCPPVMSRANKWRLGKPQEICSVEISETPAIGSYGKGVAAEPA
jgi:hypothetical protein